MFYQAFVGLLLRERFLEGNDTHEIKPILAVSRNANVGTNRAEARVERREGGKAEDFASRKEERHWEDASSSPSATTGRAGGGRGAGREESREQHTGLLRALSAVAARTCTNITPQGI